MYLLPLGYPCREHPCAALMSPPLPRLWGYLMRPDSSPGEGVGRHSQGGSGEGGLLQSGEGLGGGQEPWLGPSQTPLPPGRQKVPLETLRPLTRSIQASAGLWPKTRVREGVLRPWEKERGAEDRV